MTSREVPRVRLSSPIFRMVSGAARDWSAEIPGEVSAEDALSRGRVPFQTARERPRAGGLGIETPARDDRRGDPDRRVREGDRGRADLGVTVHRDGEGMAAFLWVLVRPRGPACRGGTKLSRRDAHWWSPLVGFPRLSRGRVRAHGSEENRLKPLYMTEKEKKPTRRVSVTVPVTTAAGSRGDLDDLLLRVEPLPSFLAAILPASSWFEDQSPCRRCRVELAPFLTIAAHPRGWRSPLEPQPCRHGAVQPVSCAGCYREGERPAMRATTRLLS